MLQYDAYSFDLDVFRSGSLAPASGRAGQRADNTSEGELDSVVTATLQREVLCGWTDLEVAEDVREVFKILEGGAAFSRLLERPQELSPLPGKKSNLSVRQVAHLVEAGVLVKKKWTDERVRNVVKAFTVPKPSGKRRLVVDASNVGEAQVDPPHVSLPTIANIKQLVSDYSWVVQLDGKSWFYQVAAKPLRSFFAVRTVLGLHWLVVLAMGWSWSVWIAQTLAVAIGQRAAQLVSVRHLDKTAQAQYIDNFIVVGQDSVATSALTTAVKEAAAECGAVLKPSSDVPQTVEVLLGIHCDFAAKTVCVKHDWVVGFKKMAGLFLLSPGRYSLKTAWKVLGNVMWGMRVLGIRQLSFPYMKLWMGRQAKKITTGRAVWSDRCAWWPHALNDLREVVKQISSNSPVSVTKIEATSAETLWADASLKGGAYILELAGAEKAFRWGAQWAHQRIHILEAEALRRGVFRWVSTRQRDESLKMMTDNILVFHGLRNMKAKGILFSRILDSLCTALVGVEWSVHWVPSACQKADKLSRLFN